MPIYKPTIIGDRDQIAIYLGEKKAVELQFNMTSNVDPSLKSQIEKDEVILDSHCYTFSENHLFFLRSFDDKTRPDRHEKELVVKRLNLKNLAGKDHTVFLDLPFETEFNFRFDRSDFVKIQKDSSI